MRLGRVNWLAAVVMTIGMSLLLIGIAQTSTWGWGSPKSLALMVGGLAVIALWVAIEVRSDQPAGRHDDDAHPRRLDDEPRRLPDRRRHVLVVHPVPAVRAAPQEHGVRVRRVSGGLQPLPAAGGPRDGCARQHHRASRSSLRIKARTGRGLGDHSRRVHVVGGSARAPVRHPDQLRAAWASASGWRSRRSAT